MARLKTSIGPRLPSLPKNDCVPGVPTPCRRNETWLSSRRPKKWGPAARRQDALQPDSADPAACVSQAWKAEDRPVTSGAGYLS